MSEIFHLQTPNSYKNLVGTKEISLIAASPNTLGEAVTLGNISLNLTNSELPVYIKGSIPVQIQPITFGTGSGNVDLVLNIYNYAQSANPIYSAQKTILYSTGISSITTPKVSNILTFEFLDTPDNSYGFTNKNYVFIVQLYSSVAITTGNVNLNSPSASFPSKTSYFNISAQQIS